MRLKKKRDPKEASSRDYSMDRKAAVDALKKQRRFRENDQSNRVRGKKTLSYEAASDRRGDIRHRDCHRRGGGSRRHLSSGRRYLRTITGEGRAKRQVVSDGARSVTTIPHRTGSRAVKRKEKTGRGKERTASQRMARPPVT